MLSAKRPLILTAASLLLLSGCATVPRVQSQPSARTQLVLLNIDEASGWVAYACEGGDDSKVDNYRIQVIHEASGTVIYESEVPLAANLCTHGFEMAMNDPRLLRMAHEVDRDIITPIEGPMTQPHAGGAGLMPPPREAPIPAVPPTHEESGDPSNGFVMPELTVLEATANALVLDQGNARSLQVGQRFFIRTEPKVITSPITGEEIMVSKGQVAGLLEITEVNGSRAVATRMSGEIPEAGYLEVAD